MVTRHTQPAPPPGRRRRIAIFLAGLAAVAVVVALSQALRPGGALSSQAVYTDRVNGFALAYPSDWKILRDFQSTDVVLLPPQVQGTDFQDNINISHTPGLADKNALKADAVLDAVKKAGAAVELIEQKTEPIGEKDSLRLVYLTTLQSKQLAVISYIIPLENTYIITCTTLPDRLAAFRKSCDDIAASFHAARQ